MREQLVSYVDLLFAGTKDTDDIKQEILQNTLDRYDDLVAQGKAPEAAYRLAISGIGDINEILGQETPEAPAPQPLSESPAEEKENKLRRAVAIAMYISCPIPLFALGDTLGLCLMLLLVAAATALMVMSAKKEPADAEELESVKSNRSPQATKRIKTIKTVNGIISVIAFLLISFFTGAWYITWLVFPLFGCINGLLVACIDLKEAM